MEVIKVCITASLFSAETVQASTVTGKVIQAE